MMKVIAMAGPTLLVSSLTALAGSLPNYSVPLHDHQVAVTATVDGTTMTIAGSLPSEKKDQIKPGLVVSGGGISDAPAVVGTVAGHPGQLTLSAPESVPTPTQLTLTLPARDEAEVQVYLLGDGRGKAGQCDYAAAAATRDANLPPDIGSQERAALKAECAARAEPDDWPDKALEHARAAALHQKALVLDARRAGARPGAGPTLPDLSER